MSSILTNTSAMVALQTLKTTNANLEKTQGMIATGKKVESAKDNAAVWAISKVMESDVAGFKAISESLGLGESTVAVARNAAETVTDLLTEIKAKVVASQEENVDRAKIQTDIEALTDQIKSVVGAAQFNGLNLVNGSGDKSAPDWSPVNVLSSLDRAADGTVAASSIDVDRQDITTTDHTLGGGTSITAHTVGNATIAVAAETGETTITVANTTTTTETLQLEIAGQTFTSIAAGGTGATDTQAAIDDLIAKVEASDVEGVTLSRTGSALTITSAQVADGVFTQFDGTTTAAVDGRGAELLTFDGTETVAEDDSFQVTVNGSAYTYTAAEGDTFEDVANYLKSAINLGDENLEAQVTTNAAGDFQLAVLNVSDAAITDFAITAAEDGTRGGELSLLDSIDVTFENGGEEALNVIEDMIQTGIDTAAAFGSAQGRIEIQSNFVGKLMDSMKAGIGTLVDADMEAASARLQALQVQQQLGIQSLSIANQAPQSVLSLFR